MKGLHSCSVLCGVQWCSVVRCGEVWCRCGPVNITGVLWRGYNFRLIVYSTVICWYIQLWKMWIFVCEFLHVPASGVIFILNYFAWTSVENMNFGQCGRILQLVKFWLNIYILRLSSFLLVGRNNCFLHDFLSTENDDLTRSTHRHCLKLWTNAAHCNRKE